MSGKAKHTAEIAQHLEGELQRIWGVQTTLDDAMWIGEVCRAETKRRPRESLTTESVEPVDSIDVPAVSFRHWPESALRIVHSVHGNALRRKNLVCCLRELAHYRDGAFLLVPPQRGLDLDRHGQGFDRL